MLFRKFFHKLSQGSLIDHSDSISEDLARELKDQAKQLAYKKILKQSRFLERDSLNEYDEDYRFFTPLGDLITVEMRNALDRLASTNQKSSSPVKDDEENPVLENKEPDSDRA